MSGPETVLIPSPGPTLRPELRSFKLHHVRGGNISSGNVSQSGLGLKGQACASLTDVDPACPKELRSGRGWGEVSDVIPPRFPLELYPVWSVYLPCSRAQSRSVRCILSLQKLTKGHGRDRWAPRNSKVSCAKS